jgi:hypothetical protein
MNKILMVTVVVAALVSTSAFAEDEKLVGAYAGAELGYTKVQNDAQATANALVNTFGGSAIVTQDTGVAIGRLFAGYNINENVAVELGYLQTGDVSQHAAGVAGNSVAYTGSANVSVSGVDYAVLVRPSIASGLNGLFAKFGGHYLEASSDVTLTGTSTLSVNQSVKGSGFLVGFGYQAPVLNNIDFRASYTYYDSVAGENGYANVVSVGLLGKF